MSSAEELTPEIRDKAEAILASNPDELIALRSLTRLYFDSRPSAKTPDKKFLLSSVFSLGSKHVPESSAIFNEEAQRFRYRQPKKRVNP